MKKAFGIKNLINNKQNMNFFIFFALLIMQVKILTSAQRHLFLTKNEATISNWNILFEKNEYQKLHFFLEAEIEKNPSQVIHWLSEKFYSPSEPHPIIYLLLATLSFKYTITSRDIPFQEEILEYFIYFVMLFEIYQRIIPSHNYWIEEKIESIAVAASKKKSLKMARAHIYAWTRIAIESTADKKDLNKHFFYASNLLSGKINSSLNIHQTFYEIIDGYSPHQTPNWLIYFEKILRIKMLKIGVDYLGLK